MKFFLISRIFPKISRYVPFLWLPWSISVTQHSSRAPDGLWTFASIAPFAPFRLTANDAGWLTFKPDSCSTTHTYTLNTIAPPSNTNIIQLPICWQQQCKLLLNAANFSTSHCHIQMTSARVYLTWRSLTRLKRGAVQWKGRQRESIDLWQLNQNERKQRKKKELILRKSLFVSLCPCVRRSMLVSGWVCSAWAIPWQIT